MHAPEQLVLNASGMSFGALAWGDRGAPLTLMIHGYPDTAWTWRHLGPFLAERGWRAVAPFTRGYAPTELAPNDRYLVADQVGDVLALHAELGGDARSVLIGHDWGALATWGATNAAPDRFARYAALALPTAATLLKPWTSLSTLGIAARQARMSWYFVYNQLPGAERGLDRVIPKHWRDWSPGYDAREDLRHVFEALRGPGRRRARCGTTGTTCKPACGPPSPCGPVRPRCTYTASGTAVSRPRSARATPRPAPLTAGSSGWPTPGTSYSWSSPTGSTT
ncbi:MAG TPA: alpha/beta fold hydrolase [Pseudonocardia sp.]|uniref:alpha/beta fold hydrolase n=1 Tax=Pseudonocardia sp. TaxID=60912 RepID=UPI002F3F4362